MVEFFDSYKQPNRPAVQGLRCGGQSLQRTFIKPILMQLFKNNNMVGIEVVIGDYNGNIFGALGQKIALPQSIEHVQAHVASRATVFARELSLFKLIFEGDCLRVIKAINTKEPCKSLFGHIIEEIWSFSSALMACSFQHIKREGNKLAHALARRAVVSADTDVWVKELPVDLDDVFNLDLA